MRLSPLQPSSRVADPGFFRGDILCNNGAHPDDCASANPQWAFFRSLFDDRASPNIGVVLDNHVPVARDPRREGHELSDDAVMRHVGLNVAVEETADRGI